MKIKLFAFNFLCLLLLTNQIVPSFSFNLRNLSDPAKFKNVEPITNETVTPRTHFETFAFTMDLYTSLWRLDTEAMANTVDHCNRQNSNGTIPKSRDDEDEDVEERQKPPYTMSPLSIPKLLTMLNHPHFNFPPEEPFKVLMAAVEIDSKAQEAAQQNLTMRSYLNRTYTQVFNELARNPQLTSSSDIYVPSKNVTSLGGQVHYLSFKTKKINQGVHRINALITNKTNGMIEGQPVPRGGWYGAPFGGWTSAVFIHTLHFEGHWVNPFKSIGLQNFKGESGTTKTEFMEATGEFYFYQSENEKSGKFKILGIPLATNNDNQDKEPRNVLILIQQENSKCLMNSDDKLRKYELFQNSTLKKLKIQIPIFDFSATNPLAPILQIMGMNAVCSSNATKSLFGMVEHNRVILGEKLLQISSAAGTSLYSPEILAKIITGKIDEGNEEETEKLSTKKNSPRTTRAVNGKGEEPIEKIGFDSEFTWILMDRQIGPIFMGNYLDPFIKKVETISEGFEWLPEVEKYTLWGCP